MKHFQSIATNLFNDDGSDSGGACRHFFVTTPRRHRRATACKQSAAYAMGWRVAQDCGLGLTMAQNGEYLDYGSYVMLMPEVKVGVFVMANRTYTGPSAPAWDSGCNAEGRITQKA